MLDDGKTHLTLGNVFGNVRSLAVWLSKSSLANSSATLSRPWRSMIVCVYLPVAGTTCPLAATYDVFAVVSAGLEGLRIAEKRANRLEYCGVLSAEVEIYRFRS